MASLSNINGIFDVHSTGAIQFNGNHGTAGQILKSNGNAAPTWVAASTVIGGPYLPLTGGTLTGATATAAGISFTVGGTLSANGGINGLTLANGGISGSNYNIAGVNQLTIADPGEGIVFTGTTTLTLAVIDDTVDDKLKLTNATQLDLNSTARITNLLDPSSAQDAATKAYVDSVTPGVGPFLPLTGGTLTGALAGTSATFSGNVTSTNLLTVIGDGHLFLGADGETPKIDMMYDDHASGAGWDTRIFTGKTDDLPNGQSFPTSTIAGGYGTQYQANSDGAFFGIIPYTAGHFRPVINWGDDIADSPFSFQFNGVDKATVSSAGVITAPTFVGALTGNATTATTLQTARTIAGVSFNGSANISLNNNAITNGAGYITSYTETDTLATVTARGASTGTSSTFGSTGVNTKLRVVDTTYYTSPTYSWTNSAIQTTSMEIIDATTNNANVCATLVMHNYGDGGVKFRMGNTGDKTLYLSSGQSAGAGNPTDDNSGTYFDEMRINNAVVYHTGNLPSGSGVTSVATGSGLTGGTITSTGTLSVDSTVIRTTGNQSITGNTKFYPSSTGTGYSTAAIELMASSSGTGGTPPRISFHWGGVVASLITIEANGTIAVRNNPGNAYEQFKASTITATSSFSGNLTGNVTGNVTGSSGSCTGNSATATLATTATGANGVVITGYGNSTFSFYQSSGSFSGFSGWHNYYIGNHGNGANYYNTIIAIPFWGSPRYSRLEGNVQRGPFEFWTSERTIVSTHDVTAPRYYDTNTAYYGDFASTSNINGLTLVGTFSGQNGYFLQDLAVGFNSGAIGGKVNTQINSNNGIGVKNNLNGKSGVTGLLQYTSASYASSGYNMVFQAVPPSGTDQNMLLCYLNGNIVNRFNSYGQYSDIKLKENIVDTTPKLEDVKKIRIRNFNFKGDPYKQIGVVAQEFEEVFPGLVEDKEVPNEEGTTKTVKYSVLVPILVKAIQELEARVKELENK